MENKTTAKKYIGFGEIFRYSFGILGIQMIIGLLNTYQAEFYVSYMGANFATVGIVVLVVKLLSSVFDLIIGNRIDRKQSKMGKLKPYMLYSIAPVILFTILLFIKVPFQGALVYAWLFVLFLLWNMSITLGDVSSQAMSSVLTPDVNERTKLLSFSNLIKGLGIACTGVLLPIICIIIPGGSSVLNKNDAPISYTEYLSAAIILPIAGMLLFSMIVFTCKERVPYKSEKMSMRDMWLVFKENRPLKLVVLSMLLGCGRFVQNGIGVQTAYVVFGSQGLSILFTTIGIGQLVTTATLPWLCKKFGEKNVYVLLSLSGFVFSLLSYFIGFENKIMMAISMLFVGLQFTAFFVMPAILVADSVDWYEYKTGKRTEGVAFSILTLLNKVSLAVSTALGLIMLSVANYSPTAQSFTSFTKNTVYFTFIAFPGIFGLLSIIPMLKYDLHGKLKQTVSEELLKRREQMEIIENVE